MQHHTSSRGCKDCRSCLKGHETLLPEASDDCCTVLSTGHPRAQLAILHFSGSIPPQRHSVVSLASPYRPPTVTTKSLEFCPLRHLCSPILPPIMLETSRRKGLQWVNSKYIYGRVVRLLARLTIFQPRYLTCPTATTTHHNLLDRDGHRRPSRRQVQHLL